jgi:predicted glycosyltransferase
MCGYNTALDVLQTGVSAVFVPFDAGGEVEQSLRAKALSEQPNIVVLKNADLSVETLILAIQRIQNLDSANKSKTNFDGATKTVNIIETMLSETAHNG